MEDQQQGGGLKQIAGDLIKAGPEAVVGLLSEIFSQLSDQGVDPGAVVAEAMGGGEGGGQQQQAMPQPQGGPPAGGGVDPAAAAMEAEMMAAAMAGDQRKGRVTLR